MAVAGLKVYLEGGLLPSMVMIKDIDNTAGDCPVEEYSLGEIMGCCC